jgi:hypothetical protein
MDGVTILNEFEVVTKRVFSWEAFWWGVLIGAIIGFGVAVIFGLQEADWLAFFVGLGIFCTILGLLIGLLGGFVLCPKPVEYETHYEVSINKDVNMQEFMDKYEIIETRGSIYTVREKCE